MTAPNTDARRFEALLSKLAGKVDDLERGRAPQLGYSSLDDRTMLVTVNGQVRQVWGPQPDGTVGVRNVNGPPPPRPNTPDLTPVLGGLDAAWNGELAGDLPADFSHITVHRWFVDGFAWSQDNRVGTLYSKGSVTIAPLEVAPHYVRFVAWNTSGKPSEPSFQASATPLQAVSDEVLAGIRNDINVAAQDVAKAAIATATIGRGQLADQAVDLSKLADGSVNAGKLVDGAVTVAKVAFSAREIGALATFSQPTAPPAPAVGDTWADSDDGYKLYRWDGSTWVLIQDAAGALAQALAAQSTAANALAAATSAEAKVDGKVTIFYQATAPAAASSHLGDLWLDTANGNRLARYDGSTWVPVDDTRLAAALSAAATAQSTADGKIDTYYAATAPAAAGLGVGDLWFDTSNGNRAARWDGTAWINLPIGAPAISASAVTTEKIATDAVTAEKIIAAAIGTEKLAANSVIAGKIAANAITAVTIAAGAISAEKIAAAAVSADKIAASAVTAEKIASLAVTTNKLAANSVDATKITAGSITAAHLTASIVLASRLSLKDSGGAETVVLDGTTGSVSIKGTIRTADSGERIVIRETAATNDMRFYPVSGGNFARLYARGYLMPDGQQYGGVLMQSPLYNSRRSFVWSLPERVTMFRGVSDGSFEWGGNIDLQDDAAGLDFHPSSTSSIPSSGIHCRDNNAHMFTGGPDTPNARVLLNVDGIHLEHKTKNFVSLFLANYQWQFFNQIFSNITLSTGFFFAANGVTVYNPNGGALKALTASNVTGPSARATKTAIEPVPFDSLTAICGARTKMWERKDDPKDQHGRRRKNFGPMADDLPVALQVTVPLPDGGEVAGVDLGNQIGVAWDGIAKLADRLDAFAARLAALEKEPA